MFKRKLYAKPKKKSFYEYRIYTELNLFNRIKPLRCTISFSSDNTYIKAVKKWNILNEL